MAWKQKKQEKKEIKPAGSQTPIGPLKEKIESLEKYFDELAPHISRLVKKD